MEKPKAILFDLDCTLTDRLASLAKYSRVFVERFSHALENRCESVVTERFAEVDEFGYLPRSRCWAHLLTTLSWREPVPESDLNQLWETRWAECAVPAGDAIAVLKRLAEEGFVLGIITNGHPIMQQRKIDLIGVGGYMREIVVSGAVRSIKPNREIFHHACERLGVAPGDAWFVGDHPINDAFGAKNAGLVDIWLRGSSAWPAERPAPTHVIDRLSQLLEMLQLSF